MYRVVLTRVRREIDQCPEHIQQKLYRWVMLVEEFGLPEIRRIPGFHDEPLKGRRVGQRSIRLSRSYRAIYIELTESHRISVVLIEVNKHD